MTARSVDPWPTFQYEAMATEFSLTIAGRPVEYARQAAAMAGRELDRLEGELSRYVESSDIARANRLARGSAITIGEDALHCLLAAARISAATDRAFDPSYGSRRAADQPFDDALFALDPVTHVLTSLTDRLHLDLGAVGKGYALDVIAALLREWDITSACLQSGGSTVLTLDAPPGEGGWPIGLGDGESRRVISLERRALSGSGLAVKGEHLIDPRTGEPAQRRERVWAFAAIGAQADALSTAFFVMRDGEIADFCQAHPDIGAVLATPAEGLAAYGDVPADLLKATSTKPGRSPR